MVVFPVPPLPLAKAIFMINLFSTSLMPVSWARYTWGTTARSTGRLVDEGPAARTEGKRIPRLVHALCRPCGLDRRRPLYVHRYPGCRLALYSRHIPVLVPSCTSSGCLFGMGEGRSPHPCIPYFSSCSLVRRS